MLENPLKKKRWDPPNYWCLVIVFWDKVLLCNPVHPLPWPFECWNYRHMLLWQLSYWSLRPVGLFAWFFTVGGGGVWRKWSQREPGVTVDCLAGPWSQYSCQCRQHHETTLQVPQQGKPSSTEWWWRYFFQCRKLVMHFRVISLFTIKWVREKVVCFR